MEAANVVGPVDGSPPASAGGLIQLRAEELSAGVMRLRDAADAAEGVAASSRNARALTSAAGAAPAASAIDSFLQRWSYGLGHMSGDLRSLASLLARARQSYEEVDRAVGEGP
ncbi:MAG: hypothetical protein ACYCTI_03445 [Acidimicrobiales bacterium]